MGPKEDIEGGCLDVRFGPTGGKPQSAVCIFRVDLTAYALFYLFLFLRQQF